MAVMMVDGWAEKLDRPKVVSMDDKRAVQKALQKVVAMVV